MTHDRTGNQVWLIEDFGSSSSIGYHRYGRGGVGEGAEVVAIIGTM